jgi:hypothetical protein
MTPYEIADLRAALGERLLGIVRVWLTGMFAVFAVTYTAGSALDGFSLAALLAFYGSMMGILIGLMNLAFRQMDALDHDAHMIENREDMHILSAALVARPRIASKISIGLMGFSFITYCAYVAKIVS